MTSTLAETKDTYGMSALYYASSAGHSSIIAQLVDSSADVGGRSPAGWTPLHAAAWNGHRDAVEALLVRQAPALAKNSVGETARALAETAGHLGVGDQLKLWENGWRKEGSVRVKDEM